MQAKLYRMALRRLLGIHVKQTLTSCEMAENSVLGPATQIDTDIREDRRKLPKWFNSSSSTRVIGIKNENNEITTIKHKPDSRNANEQNRDNLKIFLNSNGVHEPRFLETAEINEVARSIPKSLKLSRFVPKGHGYSLKATLKDVWRTNKKQNERIVSKDVPSKENGEHIELGEVDSEPKVQTLSLEEV